MSQRIELGELETFLYASADIVRGHVEASDYKSFVFPLLFLSVFAMFMMKKPQMQLRNMVRTEQSLWVTPSINL